MRRLNVKLVLWLSISSVVAVVGVFFLHRWQVYRTARVLLAQGQQAKEEGNLEEAASFLSQYVAYNPDDTEQAVEMATLMADVAEQPGASRRAVGRAFGALEETLRRHPDRDDVRRRLVKYTMLMRRFGDTADHLQALLKNNPQDGELLTQLGQCQSALGKDRDAVKTLSSAIEKSPANVPAYSLLAAILRERLEQGAEADTVINKMVTANPEDFRAYLNRARYLQTHYKSEPGQEATPQREMRKADVQKALELAPEETDALLLASNSAFEDRDFEGARGFLEKGLKLHPGEERFYESLVQLDLAQGDVKSVTERLKSAPKTHNFQVVDLELKLQDRDLDGAREIIKSLEKDDQLTRQALDYFRARIAFAEGKWLESSREFERLRTLLPGQEIRMDLLLGQCYEMLGEPDRQVEAYQRAITASPNLISAHIGLGRAYMATGKPEKALAQLDAVKRAQGVNEFVKNPAVRNTLVALLLDRNARLPESERDWTQVDELVAATAELVPDSAELLLLQANVLEQKKQSAEARELLETAIAKNPKDSDLWLTLVKLIGLQENAAASLAKLTEAEAQLGDTFAVRLTRIMTASQLPAADEAKAILAKAAMGIDKFSAAEQDRLRRALGTAFFQVNDMDQARAQWSKVEDPRIQYAVFEAASKQVDDAGMQAVIADVKKHSGAGAPDVKYLEARRLLTLVRAGKEDKKTGLTEARRLIRRASEQRPRWSLLARAEADIDIQENKPDEAIAQLQRAIDMGEADVTVVRQLAELLHLRGRNEEAERALQYANARAASTSGSDTATNVDLLPASIAQAENDIPKAIKILEQALTQNPDDSRTLMWLGQLLQQASRTEEAEQMIRKAVAVKPDSSLAWIVLVRFLANENRGEEAKTVVEEALQKLPSEQADLVAAQCYELLKENELAEKHFLKARDVKPDDLGLTRGLAAFYLRNRETKKGQQELDRLLAAKPASDSDKEQIAWANRETARLVASGGTFRDFQQAMERLKPKAEGASLSFDDRVAKAELLANRPEAESRLEAIQILEGVKNEINLPPQGQFALAQLYEATGNWRKCRDEMLNLIGRSKDNPAYLRAFVAMLLRHNEVESARPLADQLESLSPNEPSTVALKARMLVKQGRAAEGIDLLRGMLPKPMPRDKIGQLIEVARLLEDLEQYEAAESMYREYVALDPKAVLVLASFLGRHGTLQDALDLCEQGLESNNVETVGQVALAALRDQAATATAEDYQRVENWIKKTLARNPDSTVLQLELTELLDLQGRYAELEEEYQRLLKNPKLLPAQRALVLNNLAFLVASQDKTGDSRRQIDEAIGILGPRSDLLDTRAVVRIAHGEAKGAIDDLTLAVLDQPTGPKFFHLALAYELAKDRKAAGDAMKKAVDTYGLKATDVTPLEQPKFKRLAEAMASN